MQETTNLKLPIYDNPNADTFDLTKHNAANQAIEDAYNEMKSDYQEAKFANANLEVVAARKGEIDLSAKIGKIDSDLNEKAKQSEVRLNNVKIDTLDLSDTVKQQIVGTAPINSVPYGIMNGACTPNVTYQHARGDSEMVGDATISAYIIALYDQMTNYTVFNRVDLPMACGYSQGYFEYKIFVRDSNTAFIPSSEIPVASGVFTSETTNHDENKLQTILLDNSIFVPKDKYLFVILRSPGLYFYCKKWFNDAVSAPFRHGMVLNTTDDWGSQLLFYDPTYHYWQPSFKLYYELTTQAIREKSVTLPLLSDEINSILNNISATSKVKLSLPDKYELVVGDTFELFYKGIVLATDPYRYNIKVTSTKGYAYKRRYVYSPVIGDIGTQTVTISIYNDEEILLDSKTVNLIVKAKAANPSSIINVLSVGDSLTSGGQWVTELYRRLVTVDGLSNVNFVGTQGTSPKYEGYGGWTIDMYLANMSSTSIVWINGAHDKDNTDQHSVYQDVNGDQWKLETIQSGKIKAIRVSGTTSMPTSGTLTWISGGTHASNIVFTSTTPESGNPFWNENTSTVDFANYATELGISSLDHCYILLGWNNTQDKTEITYKISVRNFINELRADFANCKITLIGLQVPDIDGLGANYGASWNYRDILAFVFNLNRWLKEVAAEYSNVDFINLAGQFDSEYNMQASNTAVNTRNSTTERKGYNGIHPALEGYYQIADAVYRNIHSKL